LSRLLRRHARWTGKSVSLWAFLESFYDFAVAMASDALGKRRHSMDWWWCRHCSKEGRRVVSTWMLLVFCSFRAINGNSIDLLERPAGLAT
jgi:hypothetical protein